MAVAHRMKEMIIQKLGGQIQVKDIVYRTFPEATKLAATKTAKLLELIKNKKKADYVSAISKAFSQIEEQWLRTAPYDDVYEWFTGIKGIGNWSAHFVMIRGLGRMEKLTSIEPQLKFDVAKIYRGEEKPVSEDDVCEIAEKYGKWKGYWAYYLRIFAEFAYVFDKGKKYLMQ